MKLKLMLSAVLISVVALGGCASTKNGAAPAVNTKNAKALTAQDIIARYAKLYYGKDGPAKHPSMTIKGTLSIEQFSMEGPFTRYVMAPDSNVSTIEIMGMTLNTGCHKGVCWTQQPGAGTTTLTGDVAAIQLQQADYTQWLHLERYYTSLDIVEPTDGKESPNHKIKAVKKNGDTDYFEFSKESGLLVAAVIEGDAGQGRMKIGLQFKNYKQIDGMMLPMEMVQSLPQATMKLTFADVDFGPVPEANFVKPN